MADSPQAPLTHFRSGFESGYLYVLEVLSRVVDRKSSMDPRTRQILNRAFTAAVETLKEDLPNVLKGLPR